MKNFKVISICFLMQLYFCSAMEEIHKDICYRSLVYDPRGIAIPDNDTILLVCSDKWETYSIKTNDKKKSIILGFRGGLEDFDCSKNGKLAIATMQNLLVYDIKTGNRLYSKDACAIYRRIVFCSDNEQIIDSIYDHIFINTENERREIVLPFIEQKTLCFSIATNPINDNLLIMNYKKQPQKIKSKQYKNKKYNNEHIIIAINNNNIKKKIENCGNALSGEYNSNAAVIAINDRCKRYKLYNTYDYKHYLSIPSYESETKDRGKKPVYCSMAFHPKKAFVALINICNNSIEFWNYVTKSSEPFHIINMQKPKERFDYDAILDRSVKFIAFSPDGEYLVAVDTVRNGYYRIRMENINYKYVAVESMFCYWILKNFIRIDKNCLPRDIMNLIIVRFMQMPDIQYITQKLKQLQLERQQAQQSKKSKIKRENTKK
jgi:WD40 repeat protein